MSLKRILWQAARAALAEQRTDLGDLGKGAALAAEGGGNLDRQQPFGDHRIDRFAREAALDVHVVGMRGSHAGELNLPTTASSRSVPVVRSFTRNCCQSEPPSLTA